MMKRVILLGALLGVGCLAQPPGPCNDGSLCTEGFACADRGGCAPAEQVAACEAKGELEACEVDGDPERVCMGGVCVPAGCGNGVRETGELCDDGNNRDGDGCSARCDSSELCGNGIKDTPLGEQCDDGNLADGDDCQHDCLLPRCGDGVVDVALAEACDDGAANGDLADAACRTDCQPRRCGDGIADLLAGEICDDRNQGAGDGCTPDCLSDETCGNGVLDRITGEVCDDGNRRELDGCSSRCSDEVLRWRKFGGEAPRPRAAGAATFDPGRQRAVFFGGSDGLFGEVGGDQRSDTWEWDGTWWQPILTDAAPTARRGTALAYDPASAHVVLFGGDTGIPRADTWRFDGRTWTEVVVATAPPARRDHVLVNAGPDTGLVVFGGSAGAAARGDTWRFDGTTWAEVPGAGPSARVGAAAAYDAVRGRLVLFGGLDDGGTALGDTWEFDGAGWSVRALVVAPPARAGATMVFDVAHGDVVMVGGRGSDAAPRADAWRFDGTTWTEVLGAGPSPRAQASAAYDSSRGQLVIFGGLGASNAYAGDTWLLDDSAWHAAPAPVLPVQRRRASMAYDPLRARVVMFGGATYGGFELGDTWEWDGARWTQVFPAHAPSVRRGAAMEFDPRAGKLLLFGGGIGLYNNVDHPIANYDDTWLYDGVDWVEATVAQRPYARMDPAMAYDPVGQRMVISGGMQGAENVLYWIIGDSWAFDGTSWTVVGNGTAPTRMRHAMAFDPASQQLVQYGGITYNPLGGVMPLSDTWTLDAADAWVLRGLEAGPLPRAEERMLLDPRRGAVMMHGGLPILGAGYNAFNDTWRLDADGWHDVSPDVRPPTTSASATAYDAARGEIVWFGGVHFNNILNETWVLGYQAVRAPETCVDGIDHDEDGAAACDDADCWAVCAPLCPMAPAPDAAACAPDAPACGDGTCTGAESCRSCPTDCAGCAATCGDGFCDAPEAAATCPGDCAA